MPCQGSGLRKRLHRFRAGADSAKPVAAGETAVHELGCGCVKRLRTIDQDLECIEWTGVGLPTPPSACSPSNLMGFRRGQVDASPRNKAVPVLSAKSLVVPAPLGPPAICCPRSSNARRASWVLQRNPLTLTRHGCGCKILPMARPVESAACRVSSPQHADQEFS